MDHDRHGAGGATIGLRSPVPAEDLGAAVVLSPYWAGSPYELLVLPTTHEARVTASSPADVVAVGRAVRDGLRRVRALLGDVPYNLVLHTAPRATTAPTTGTCTSSRG